MNKPHDQSGSRSLDATKAMLRLQVATPALAAEMTHFDADPIWACADVTDD